MGNSQRVADLPWRATMLLQVVVQWRPQRGTGTLAD